MTTQLHEILAVESSQEKSANNMITESIKTLGKETLFNGLHRTLEMFRAEDKNSEVDTTQEVTSTVDENIDYLAEYVSKYWDTTLQKDQSNQKAVADLVVDGVVVAKNLPATFLLGLESKLSRLRAVYEAIPTLSPGRNWKLDETQAKKGVYVDTNPEIQLKTRKDPEFRVVYEATKEHPAQIEKVERVFDVGRFINTTWSGKLTPQAKADRLARLTNLLQAVKRARTKANQVEVAERIDLGSKLFSYINNGAL